MCRSAEQVEFSQAETFGGGGGAAAAAMLRKKRKNTHTHHKSRVEIYSVSQMKIDDRRRNDAPWEMVLYVRFFLRERETPFNNTPYNIA